MKIRPVGAELFHKDGRTNGRMGRHDVANNIFSLCYERTEKTLI
jgi:hypothetical protein